MVWKSCGFDRSAQVHIGIFPLDGVESGQLERVELVIFLVELNDNWIILELNTFFQLEQAMVSFNNTFQINPTRKSSI